MACIHILCKTKIVPLENVWLIRARHGFKKTESFCDVPTFVVSVPCKLPLGVATFSYASAVHEGFEIVGNSATTFIQGYINILGSNWDMWRSSHLIWLQLLLTRDVYFLMYNYECLYKRSGSQGCYCAKYDFGRQKLIFKLPQ